MSVENYIRAMPKVDLHMQFEGAFSTDTMLMLADQNEIASELKDFNAWVGLLENPDSAQLDAIMQTTSCWAKYPEDLARLIYDLGLSLSKQNIRYAEICIDPTIYTENGLSFEQFMNALTDGSDKVQRGWNVRLAWILVIPRSKPRKGDDVARWVANAIGRKGSIVGIGLYGPEDVQPPGQFKRPFVTAEKKGFPRVLYAGNVLGPEGVTAALDEFERVERLVDAWGIAESPETLEKLVALDIPLAVAPVRELRLGRIAQYGEYPLRRLYDDNIKLILGTGMPNLYRTTLTDEYLTLVQQDILSVEELEELTLNAIRYSFLPDEDREKLLAEFAAEYTRLRAEHLEKEVASDES